QRLLFGFGSRGLRQGCADGIWNHLETIDWLRRCRQTEPAQKVVGPGLRLVGQFQLYRGGSRDRRRGADDEPVRLFHLGMHRPPSVSGVVEEPIQLITLLDEVGNRTGKWHWFPIHP